MEQDVKQDVEEEQELTLGQIRERMAEVEAANGEDLKQAIIDYLGTRLVQASLIGRAYSISSMREREQFAEWITGLMDQVYRYAVVTGHPAVESEGDDDE